MNILIDGVLTDFAKKLNKPIFAVGGYVRNFLIDGNPSLDIDLASSYSVEELIPLLKEEGFKIIAEYKHTGTIVFSLNGQKYEYTSFRKDVYKKGGGHIPVKTLSTDDIVEDALRRDFRCNAIYYDIKNQVIVDPLNGVNDVINKVIDTVKEAKLVFESDGLRLMRLARFSAQLGFAPTKEVIEGAKAFADNIKEVSVERIFDELKKILVADEAYSFSPKDGHYRGLKILSETKVLDRILPELTLGRGMAQRADFHKYDVLEHGLRAVLYADKEVRLDALLHDVGKPYCMVNFGKYHGHEKVGVEIVEKILNRLKVDNKTKRNVKFTLKNHMLDLKMDMREGKIRAFIIKNYENLERLFAVKQADYRACMDQDGLCPTIEKWRKIVKKIKEDGTPLQLKELKISANELNKIGFKKAEIGIELERLFNLAIDNPKLNDSEKLLELAKKDYLCIYKKKLK